MAPARLLGGDVFVPDWNLRFHPDRPAPQDLCAVAIREQSFVPACEDNGRAVLIETVLEQPFSWLVQFRYRGQAAESPSLWWQVDKNGQRPPQTAFLSVSSRDILLLHT